MRSGELALRGLVRRRRSEPEIREPDQTPRGRGPGRRSGRAAGATTRRTKGPRPLRPAFNGGRDGKPDRSVKLIARTVGLIYLVASLIIFREVLFGIPSILRGQSVVVGDELVPFFNPSSQLLEQAAGQFNELTNGYEFRVRYAFLTTWLRYYKVLPFAILIVIPLIFWVVYLMTARFLDRVFTTISSQAIYLAAGFPVAFIYLIMTYSKVTHFYTLMLGLGLMTFSSLWMVFALLFAKNNWWKYAVVSSVGTLLNPAIHYLILFTLFFAMTVLTLFLGEVARWIRTGGPARIRHVPGRLLRVLRPPGRRRKLRYVIGRALDTTVGRCIAAGLLYVCVTLIPYAMFVKFVALRGVPNLSETVPGDYYFIRDASVSWAHVLSWDLAGITDKMLYGDYLAKIPRYPNMVYCLLLLVPLLVPPITRALFVSRAHRQLLGVVYVSVAFAGWATIGYAQPLWFPTFHRALAALARGADATNTPIGDLVLTIASTIVQVLRFPHRFQLILFMIAPMVMTITLAFAIDGVTRFLLVPGPSRRSRRTAGPSSRSVLSGSTAAGRRMLVSRLTARLRRAPGSPPGRRAAPVPRRAGARRARPRRARSRLPGWTRRFRMDHGFAVRLLATICVGSVFFTPFWSNESYRKVFSSGDFAGFLAPYPLHDLKELKQALLTMPEGKTVVLPPTETAKLVTDSNGVDHKFIDKFFIYYLDQPSYYYGLTGDTKNKFEFFLILRSMYYQQDWWIDLARDLDIRYIIVNRKMRDNRGVGAEYLPKVENYIEPDVKRRGADFALRFQNDTFSLYELIDPPKPERPLLLIDSSWPTFLDLVSTRLDLSRCYNFEYLPYYDPTLIKDTDPINLVTDDPRSAALDLYLLDHPGLIAKPSTKIFAFNPDIVASSYYLSPMFRSFLFFSNTKWNRTEMLTPGVFGALRGSFLGLPRATRITVPVTVPEAGRYRLLLRGAATANTLHLYGRGTGFDKTIEVRSPAENLQIFRTDEVYNADRKPVDTSGMSVADLEKAIPDQLTPVNLSFAYQDLGVIDAKAGTINVQVEKTDTNPMLIEGLMIVPEDEYQAMQLEPNVSVVTDPNLLDCSERTPLPSPDQLYVDAAANAAHPDLSQQELLDLAAADVEDMVPDSSGGVGPGWLALIGTGVLLVLSVLLVRWRARKRLYDTDTDEPDETDETDETDEPDDSDDPDQRDDAPPDPPAAPAATTPPEENHR